MNPLSRFLFGSISFGVKEEYRGFQFKFLALVLLSGALFTGLFILGEYSHLNRLNSPHLYSMILFTLTALLLWWLLRGHKERFFTLAWIYEIACLLEYSSAIAFVPQDELRVLWLYTNIPGVYILLGERAGLGITLVTVVGLILGNTYLSAPYSPNAMATAVISLIYLALFFHIYTNRSLSYFNRLRESYDRLHYLATHDSLTGVHNARAYYDLCDQQIQAAQCSGAAYSVLFVDLDHFKAINDTYGHATGDRVLKTVATCLHQNIRSSDALGRIGGEEFSLFLPATHLCEAQARAESIRQAVEQLMPTTEEGQPLKITASIGVAMSQERDRTMFDIQQKADQAMYVAKSKGRNRVSLFEPELF